MKNIKFYFKTVFIAIATLLVGCEEESYEFGDLAAPTNFVVTADIVGASAENPNGDGSGVVNFSATADDVITYKYIYEGSEKMAPNGTQTYSFGKTGLHKYVVQVIALGAAGIGSSTTVEVEVLATYNPPADLLQMLTGGSSRTWRIAAEKPGHLGLSPGDAFEPSWWVAQPDEKVGLGAYDDRMTFHIDGSFDYETNGDIWGKAPPMDADFQVPGQELQPFDEYYNYPLDAFSEKWALSAPGGAETLSFSKFGYAGMYVGGDHAYMITARSENEMTLRVIGWDNNAWYAILIAVD